MHSPRCPWINDLWEKLTKKCISPSNYAPLASNGQYIIPRPITPSNPKPSYFVRAAPEKRLSLMHVSSLNIFHHSKALNRHSFHLDSSSAHQPPLLNLNKSSQAADPLLVSTAALFIGRLQNVSITFQVFHLLSDWPVPSPLLNCNRSPSHPLKKWEFLQTRLRIVKESCNLLSPHVFISLFADETLCRWHSNVMH